jgi:DNA-binding transcriptional LysR family regulator
MIMESATLDQFAVFAAVAETGSFTAAARRLNRAQSAITYAIQKLEDHSGLVLFDRSTYRPTLTEAGHALLPRARRILDDVADYGLIAKGIAKGLEAEISIAVVPNVPMTPVIAALKAFRETFPAVQIRMSVETSGSEFEALSQGTADLFVGPEFVPLGSQFESKLCWVVDLVAVAAPGHPLARIKGTIAPEALRDHLQLVLSLRASPRDREYGVSSVNRWYLTELETKHMMLLAGLGWGSMPRDRVAADIAAGRLVELKPRLWDGKDQMPRFSIVVAFRRDRALGPAARWIVDAFANQGSSNHRQ